MDGFQSESIYWASPSKLASAPIPADDRGQLEPNCLPQNITDVDPSPSKQCDVQIHVADCVPTMQSNHNTSLQDDVDSVAAQNLQIGDDCLLCDVHDPSGEDPLHQINPPNMSLRQNDCILSQTSQSRLENESIPYNDDNRMAGLTNSTSSTQNVFAGYTGSATFCIEPANVRNTSLHDVTSTQLMGEVAGSKFCSAQTNERVRNVSLTNDDVSRQENATSCQYEQKTLDQMNSMYNQVAPDRAVSTSLPSISEDQQQSCSEITVTPYVRVQKRKMQGPYTHLRSQTMNLHEPCSSGYETSSAHGSSPYTSPDSTHSCNPGSCDNTMANTGGFTLRFQK